MTVNPYNGVLVGSRIPVDGAMRGRAGVAFDRVLLYATGGVAFATITNTYTKADFVQLSQHGVGYTVGGGLEYALNDLWSVRGEYHYTKYGNYSSYLNNVVSARFYDASDNRVTVGFSYKFVAPPPPEPAVVAKY